MRPKEPQSLVASPKLAPPFASAQTLAVMNNPMRIVGVFMTLLFLFVTHSRILEILVPVGGLIMAMALVALLRRSARRRSDVGNKESAGGARSVLPYG